MCLFFGACRVQFFLRLFIYFHFRVKNMKLVKSVFLRVIFSFISRHPETRKFFCHFPLFFTAVYFQGGSATRKKKKVMVSTVILAAGLAAGLAAA